MIICIVSEQILGSIGKSSRHSSLYACCVRCFVADIFRHQMTSVIFYESPKGFRGPELTLIKGLSEIPSAGVGGG